MAEGLGFIVDGAKECARDIGRVCDEDAKAKLAVAYKTGAQAVAIAAAQRAPRLTGRLAYSITPMSGKDWAKVKVYSRSVPYAGAVHFGWAKRNIKPNPFIFGAQDDLRAQNEAVIEAVVGRLVEIANLSK